MASSNHGDIEDFIERNIDIIVACTERGFEGAGPGVGLVYLTEDGSVPDRLHAGYSCAAKLRSGGQIELAELAEQTSYPDEAAIVLLLPNLEIVDFFRCNVKELQHKHGDPKKHVSFYHSSDLN